MKFNQKQSKFQKIIFSILILIFIFSAGFGLAVKPVQAQFAVVNTADPPRLFEQVLDKIAEAAKWAYEKAGSKALGSAVQKALNSMAYETATYLASGDEGQKPMWYGEGFGAFLENVGDNAAGYYIEEIGKTGAWGVKFNICEPKLDVKLKIGLGLVDQKKPKEPECTFSEMVDNWETEADRLQSMSEDDFLAKFQNVFEPTGSDLSASFQLQTGMLEKEAEDKLAAEKNREESEGWINKENIAGVIETFPGATELEVWSQKEGAMNNLAQYTGNALLDAANVFLNQYAITLFNKQLRELGRSSSESHTAPYDWDNLSSEDAVSSSGGISQVRENLKEIIEPAVFSTQSSYDVLAELTSCPDRNNAGPDNCVIDDQFKDAISNKMTVREAMNQGYLDPNGTVGFMSDGFEPRYDEGYPYRSLIILRKFRIIPVGWELAAEHVKNSQEISSIKLKELVDCYEDDERWCRGLVDPNWVLKAPLNYCNRQGYGSEIADSQLVEISGGGEDVSELMVVRPDTYCADEQTCIDENDDGTCNYYGYCLKEKRKWNFAASSCEPVYNTCQTFVSQEDGRTFSFLENTLEYCSQDAAGCKSYCTDYNYDDGLFTCNFDDTENKIYLNNNTKECDSRDEGCHEFIRTKAGTGANLLINSNFEQGGSGWTLTPQGGGIATTSSEDSFLGQNSLKITHDGTDGQESYATQIIEGVQPEEEITLSYYVKTDLANNGSYEGPWIIVWAQDEYDNRLTDPRNVDGGDWIDASVIKSSWNGDGNWKQIVISFITPNYTTKLEIQPFIQSVAGTAYFDAIKVERGGNATRYSDYREQGLVYQKLIPSYLEEVCYSSTGRLLEDAPAECSNYVRHCSANEVGCEMYTSQTTGAQIPAQVSPNDYCEAECVGYDTYIQNETIFDSREVNYFIPGTANTCSAESVGCDEFTNLDAIEEGGEAKEYYQYLRQCSLPSDSECADFYTWEGSDESGYQLRYFSLKVDSNDVDGNGSTNDPYLVNTGRYNGLECNGEEDYDPVNNPDCKEFNDTEGNTYYKFYHHTVTCSDDCHPYRRTEANINENLNEAGCSALGSGMEGVSDEQFYWDNDSENCYFCKNGGEWSNQQGGCIYMAIPGEGKMCDASQNGCREFTGNTGNNYQIISQYSFDDGSQEGWEGITGTNIDLSQESLTTEGESLLVNGGSHEIGVELGDVLSNASAYNLEFLAKSPGMADIEVCLRNSGANSLQEVCFNKLSENDSSTSVFTDSDWGVHNVYIDLKDYYQEHEIASDEELIIRGSSDFYVDNIRLTEVLDRYYLIKDSWNTPAVCDQNIYGEYEPWHDLGCDYYQDRAGERHYLHNFSQLCEESGVGCEIMIDTHNYSGYDSNTWLKGGWQAEVQADNFDYVVYDQNKACNSSEKGCQLLGLTHTYQDEETYSNVYYQNNPDEYNNILCNENDVGCETWNVDCSSTGGNCVNNVVFKNPGNMTCEWREGEFGEAWYKTSVKRCANNNNICQANKDCPMVGASLCDSNEDCDGGVCTLGKCYASCEIASEEDELCPAYPLKTIGLGGNRLYQPARDINGNWVGVCESGAAGCTEYIDPVSTFSENLVVNGDFSYDINEDGQGDVWRDRQQEVDLDKFTLYVLAVEAGSGQDFEATINVNSGDFYEFGERFPGQSMESLTVSASNGERKSVRFYTNRVFDGVVEVNNTEVNTGNKVELKKAVINYRLRQEVDRESCADNEVNFEKGCVLFNERTQAGNGAKKALIYDADKSDYSSAPENADSNVLLQVQPDRACGVWLACKSYVLDERESSGYMEPGEEVVCFERELCDRMDDEGRCDHYVVNNKNNLNYTPAMDIDNISGYTKIGYADSSLDNNYYPIDEMEQIGGLVDFNNGSFEIYDSSGYPTGWDAVDMSDGTPQKTINWTPNIFKVIDSPYQAKEVEGINYTNEGKAFLRYSPEEGGVVTEFIDVEGGNEYGFSALINTKNLYARTGNVRAQIRVFGFDIRGNLLTNAVISGDGVLSLTPGEPWTKITEKIEFSESVDKAKIAITKSPYNADVSGAIYVDNIQLETALEYKEGEVVPQTCRLYPAQDSLACEYVNDAGITTKGWYGYCLEYDRYPGNENTCLMWYPVDKIKGQGIEEGGGYQGRGPLYYCEEARLLTPVEYRPFVLNAYYRGCDKNQPVNPPIPPGYTTVDGSGDCVCDTNAVGNDDYAYPSSVIPTGNCLAGCDDDGSGWYEYNGNLHKWPGASQNPCGGSKPFDEADNKIKYYDPNSGQLFDDIFAYCNTIAQTVDPTGANKYWRGRVYDGTKYIAPYGEENSNSYIPYLTDYSPFGSIPEPDFRNNPTDWDGNSSINGPQPLYVHRDTDMVRAGFPHHFDSRNFMTLGQCSQNGRPCLKISNVGPNLNEADCQSGEGTCQTVNQISSGVESLKRLFAQSYGHWTWTENGYEQTNNLEWKPPVVECGGNNRPNYPDDYCAIKPKIENIALNGGQAGNIVIQGSDYINLTFNSIVDSQELPLTMYAVNWGDNENLTVSGVEMRGQPLAEKPHSIYHLYAYWDLKNKHNDDQGDNTIYCGTADSIPVNYDGVPIGNNEECEGRACCVVRPSVKIKDNWGWCNNGEDNNPCPVGGYQPYNGWIKIYEE